MVMETPTPQCVGREFVRQYYTLLNKAPLHLHRFYNHDSSFLHGGLDRPGQETKPVIGQQDIHERIMQLNFRDCHAKIRQVDSLETLEDGVVVQVSGELSNNGQPMRRFMQTFVLAPQSPKKFYVRNDIFRYQDEIFTEEEDGEIDNNLADIDANEQSCQKNISQDDDSVVYHENEVVRNGSVYTSEAVGKFATPQRESTGSPQMEMLMPESEVESTKSDWEDNEDDEEDDEEEEEELEEGINSERTTEDSVQPVTLESPPSISQEPKTYANMVSKNASASAPSIPINSSTSPISTSLPPMHKTEISPHYHKQEVTPMSSPQVGSTFGQGTGNRMSRPRVNSGQGMPWFDGGRDLSARSPEDFDGERRKPTFNYYPDAQQLFVGNLTHSITEEDLKHYFTKFGKVLDMRINTKQNQKIGGGKVPNFGFIVFEDADSVSKVLDSRPIYFNEHRLNVEEKKRPKDNRIISGGENRVGSGGSGPPRTGLSPRISSGGGPRGGSRGGMMGQGRGDNRGGMRGSYAPRR